MSKAYDGNGLFDCFSDCGVCLTVSLCLPTGIPLANNWSRSRGEDCSFCHWLGFVHPMWTRDNIRKHQGETKEKYMSDWCLYWFCGPCAICQDARELKIIGNGPSQDILAHAQVESAVAPTGYVPAPSPAPGYAPQMAPPVTYAEISIDNLIG